MYEGLHIGQRYHLRQLRLIACERGMKPLVITFTNHPLSLIAPGKAPRLITSPFEKAALIKAEGFLGDEIILLPFDEALRATSAADFLAMLRDRFGAAALLMGFNNRFGHDAPSGFDTYRDLAARAGIELIQARELPSESGISSSAIRRLIADGEVSEAARLLGRPHSATGTIAHGKALGRTIGFPTANLSLSPSILLPAPGVYAAMATSETSPFVGFRELQRAVLLPPGSLPAMVNIGCRPTVDSPGAPLSVEAHLIGLPPGTDLYGSRLTLSFIDRLRGERRFSDTEALAAQLALDRNATLARLATFCQPGN